MKLEREPVFGHKPDPKSFDYNDLSHDSNGLKSVNIAKENQNRPLSDFSNNEKDSTQLLYLVNDGDNLVASKLNLKTRREYQVKDSVAPFTKSSLEMEALEKGSDYYTDKSVMECEMPEFQVCYRESSYNSVKDICVDEGMLGLDKILFESDPDKRSLCTFVFPDEDQNAQLNKGHADVGITSPNGLKSSVANESEKEFVNGLESKDLMLLGEGNHDTMHKIKNDLSQDKIYPEDLVNMKELGTENSHHWPPSWDGDAAAQAQVSRDKASEATHTISPGFDLAAEKLSNISEEALATPVPVSEAKKSSECCLSSGLAYDSKLEERRITFDFSSIPISKVECPNCVSECLETASLGSVDDKRTNMQVVSSQAQHEPSPVTVTREECFQNGIREGDQTPDMPTVEDGTSDTQIGLSNARHELGSEQRLQNVGCTCVESPNTSSVNDGTLELQNVSSSLQQVTVREDCLQSTDTFHRETPDTHTVADGISGTETISGQFQYGPGESSFSSVGPLSGRINYSGPIPYSGSISLRSDSSTTSTRSFAFPILHSEWNSSPVRMAKADRRHIRKHRGWRQGLLCCRF